MIAYGLFGIGFRSPGFVVAEERIRATMSGGLSGTRSSPDVLLKPSKLVFVGFLECLVRFLEWFVGFLEWFVGFCG